MPQLWIIAGPNGAGKTTFTEEKIKGRVPVVNPDEIASRLNPENINSVRVKAGREAIRLQKKLLESRADFAIETTFSGKREIDLVKKAQAEGYKVTLVYLGIENKNVTVGRIAERVAGGGHNIPTADALRRYDRSMKNIIPALEAVDRAFVLDNTHPQKARLLLTKEKGQLRNISENMPTWAQKALSLPQKKLNHTEKLLQRRQLDKSRDRGR